MKTRRQWRMLWLAAQRMIALTSQIGKFEEQLRDLKGQLAALVEQTTEQRATISSQNSMIASLRGQKAA